MNDKSEKSKTKSVWLTRSEAARYVGENGESAIRAAEDRGLESASDSTGQVWLATEVLDAFKWRSKLPSAAKRGAVVRQAQRAREHEARERQRQDATEDALHAAEWQAQQREFEAEDALRARVRQKARTLREAFERDHMDERTAGLALGFESHEARYRVRDLVRRGLLRRIESPPQPRVEISFDGAREVESTWPLCSGGPFTLREEVVSLRHELVELASSQLSSAPPNVRVAIQQASTADIVVQLLRALLEASRPRQ